MNFGLYGFSNILELVRAVAFRATGKPGATAGATLAGGTISGAPTSGDHEVGELIVDQGGGTLWICTAAGTPGTWTQVVGGSGSYTLPDATTTAIGGLLVDETPASGHPVALSTIRYQMPYGVPALGGDGLVRSLSQQTGADAGITEGSRWTRASAAILTATQAWEGTAVEEPSVLFDGGTWKMWYAGGWSPRTGIGYATCPGTSDPTVAGNWTKYGSNPVIGGTAQQPTVLKVHGTFYAYYSTGSSLKVATSTDGTTWSSATTALALTGSVTQWANSAVWVENGTQWTMLIEGQISGIWKIHLATSSDGLSWALGNSGNPLTTLQVHSGGSFGGPCVPNPPKHSGRYEVWYHAVNATGGLPTDIYRAWSTDLITWTQYASNPVLTHTGAGFEIDQVADPEVAEVYGTSYLFYDGDNNPGTTASIGVASFAGPLATLVGQGGLPATLGSGGQLPQSQGGTGKDTSGATNGQVLIGKTSDHSLGLATLTAGSNVTITNGAGTITVAAAAGGSTSPLTTKGDVWGYAAADARVPVGADGLALIADSTQSLGVRWGAPQPSSLLVLLPNPYNFIDDSATDHGQPPDFITLSSGDVIGVGGM